MHRDTESNRRHQRDFVRGVYALNVKSRVGFGVTQRLRVFQSCSEVYAFVAHLAQNEISRAVDDAGDPLDTVGGQAFTQGFDDRYTTCDCRFKRDHHAFGMSSCKNFGAMHSQQSFVSRDDVLTCSNRFHHQLLGDAVSAYEFDNDVNLRVGDDGAGVIDDFHVSAYNSLRTGGVKVCHHRDLDTTASTALDLVLVAIENVKHAAADGADA